MNLSVLEYESTRYTRKQCYLLNWLWSGEVLTREDLVRLWLVYINPVPSNNIRRAYRIRVVSLKGISQ